MALKLNVITVSTRPGRVGPSVAAWATEKAKAHGAFEVTAVDIAGFNLPVFDEPKHPRLKDYAHDHTKAWSASVAAADAFVFVTPEYNYFAPPSFVNAVDYLFHEWAYKVAGIVSYGGALAGARVAQMEKLMLTSMKVMTIPEGVSVPSVATHIGEDGVFKAPEFLEPSMKAMLDELAKWAGALKPLRG
ncbi:NADPH-dependent FMN reductase [Phenylobacterium soli]|uniref:NADPH-dependent FMN reductase n=1 Tax=Phenylobacterium soli TaxID=2170551 RepID=A0A328AN58_9CAUL|nr:NADPH-dependent FMN reductase [Phenylobacterium soli]RAK56350.1 NADPH-dependent FMN reductase [Phenylobacterium soli]